MRPFGFKQNYLEKIFRNWRTTRDVVRNISRVLTHTHQPVSRLLVYCSKKPEPPEFYQSLCLQSMIVLMKVCHKMEGPSDPEEKILSSCRSPCLKIPPVLVTVTYFISL